MSSSTKNTNNMKIEHLTYDQSHHRQATRRPSAHSASKKTTFYSTSRPRRHSKKTFSIDDERPVTMWPRRDESPPETLPEMMTFLMLGERLKKEAREKGTAKTHKNMPRPGTTPPRQNQIPPPLRRKPKFSETLQGFLRSPKSAKEKNEQMPQRDEMTRVHILRERIREGKMEKVVPPFLSGMEGRLAPTQPRDPALQLPSPRATRNKKDWSSSKFGEFIDSRVYILEETRKDLAGKLLHTFEHIDYASLTHLAKKVGRNSDVSDISFCCIGETEATQDVKAHTREVGGHKRNRDQNTTIASGEGRDPWTQGPPSACRLCRKPGVRGTRGLCNDCETDFIGPTRRFDLSSSDEDEIKPIPPLKDLDFLVAKMKKETKKVRAKRKSISRTSQDKRDRRTPESSVKAELKNPATRQHSNQALLEGESENDKYRNWQTPQMGAEYERTKSLFKSWSDCYETDDFRDFEDENGSFQRPDGD